MNPISVTQLNGYIKNKIENDSNLSNVWIKGEISNFKHHSSGHMYFSLKDKASSLRCIMFRSRNANLRFLPTDGMSVIIRGYVSVFERDGQYQLYAEEMQPDGVGALYTAYLKLKETLEQEGLFDVSRKKAVPFFPSAIGVITSPTGAAVRDVINVLGRRFPLAKVVIIPVKVQGEDAPSEISRGIQYANVLATFDVLIVGRGGGSIEELWAFNTEIVARSIYNSKIPIISAVGHETDFTIADFVADLRAPTPSAAAELAVPDIKELGRSIANLTIRLNQGMRKSLTGKREALRTLQNHHTFKRPKEDIYQRALLVDTLTKRMNDVMRLTINQVQSKFSVSTAKLHGLSPLATLSRGYAICSNEEGNVINSIKKVSPQENLDVLISDGVLECIVKGTREGK